MRGFIDYIFCTIISPVVYHVMLSCLSIIWQNGFFSGFPSIFFCELELRHFMVGKVCKKNCTNCLLKAVKKTLYNMFVAKNRGRDRCAGVYNAAEEIKLSKETTL